MKRIAFISALFVCAITASAQPASFVYTEATELTLINNLFPDTPNPYHRIDTVRYKGFTSGELRQATEPVGMAVVFATDSKTVRVKAEMHLFPGGSTGPVAATGYDCYIKKDGRWIWAGNCRASSDGVSDMKLVSGLDGSTHEFLVYMPILSEVISFKIGVEDGSLLHPIENPFRHRVAVFGSSFTHGISTSRPGMAYPLQLSRMTGIQFIDMGFSGNSKLQHYFAEALKDADVDAFLFDSFSNPSPEMIRQRLFPFIETIQAAKPGVPLIFQRTICRERRNFDNDTERYEALRMALVDSLMTVACKKYDDVYYVTATNAADRAHETSVDGTHPGDYGYTLWARSIRRPVLRILRKYGIR